MKTLCILLTMAGAAWAADLNVKDDTVNHGQLIIGSQVVVNGNATFASGATFNPKIETGVPVTGYGQVQVNGTVSLGGATLTLSGAHVPLLGEAFKIIDNDGTDAVTGIFNGLPQGTQIVFNGKTLAINYSGGTGNDVVLAGAYPPVAQVTLNRQNGLYETTLTVPNNVQVAINGFRLYVDMSPYLAAYPSMKLYNASSPVNAPVPYIDYPFPLTPGQSVSVTLQFYVSNRVMPPSFQPTITMEQLAASQVPHVNDTGVPVSKMITRNDASKLLEFNTIAGKWYRVSYSPDLITWYYSPVPIKAGSNKTQWIDNGAPATDSFPAPPAVPARFYKVSQIPAP